MERFFGVFKLRRKRHDSKRGTNVEKEFLILAVENILFPHSMGVADFRDSETAARVRKAVRENTRILLVSKREGDALCRGDVGVEVDVDQAFSPFEEQLKLAFHTANRFYVTELNGERRIAEGMGRLMLVEESDDSEYQLLKERAKGLYRAYCDTSAGRSKHVLTEENFQSDMDCILSHLPDSDLKYHFSCSNDAEERTLLFIRLIHGALEIAKLEEEVQEKVKEAIDDNQREYYVREQIKALSEEIGDSDEAEDYLEKIDELKASEEVKEKLKREVYRLRRTAPASPEMALLKNYLDVCLELPWGVYTSDNENLLDAERVLDEDHYGLEKVKERLIEALAVRKLSKDGKSSILCLVGPPGIGKTSIAKSIARAMNKNYVRLSFGGVRDEAEIRGHRKTYIGSMPGRIINGIKTAGSMNPVFLMDEIDKMASDYKGDPASALLEVLDPEQNAHFRDHFLELPFDLSKVLFITTANTLDTISRPLLDRMEIIEMSGYTEIEKFEIAKRYLVPKMRKQCGVQSEWVKISDDAIREIIAFYTRESGVRGLEKQIEAVMRKVAKLFVQNENRKQISVTKSNLSKYLGKRKFTYDEVAAPDEVGVVTGLAWTAVGGDTLQVETLLTEGKGELNLTGNLGDVMKESAKIAFSFCKKVAKDYGADRVSFRKNDVHIHVPEGATPKDGPSAGVTMATSLLSALTGKRVDAKAAMTGEITLSGKVLPIGGLKEKTLAALRAGVERVYVPEKNRRDYEELPAFVKKNLDFKFVNNVEEIWQGVLR